MRMLEAAVKTLELAREHDLHNLGSDQPELDYSHLETMLARMLSQPEKFSEGKMGRWLGWMQCAVVSASCGSITLEDMKNLNREFADNDET